MPEMDDTVVEEVDLLTDTKTLINSLVIPNPQGLSLRRLCQDYKEMEGEDIPYNELGFSSLTALLRSMSDMIELKTDDNGSLVLFSIGNESTEHIIDMVAHQSKRKTKTRTPNFKRGFQRRTSTPIDPRLAKKQKLIINPDGTNGISDNHSLSGNNSFSGNNSVNGNHSFIDSNPRVITNGSTVDQTPTKPYHQMTNLEVESLVTTLRREAPKSSVELSVEKAKNGVDSKLWSEIFDVQKETNLKPLPVDTNGMLVAKTVLRQPCKIGEYSLKISSRSPNRMFINDGSELKFLHMPPPKADIRMDLTHGYDMVGDIHWGKPSNAKINELLEWITLNRKKFMIQGKELVPETLNTDFVCYRGLLSKIMVSPYENSNRWVICATKFKGTIYLCEFHETYPPPDDYYNKLSFGGFRFEQYLTSYEADIPPDPNDFDTDHHEFCAVMRTRLMAERTSHSLAFGAELDCIIPHVNDLQGLTRNFVELKTTKIMANEYHYRSFRKHKLLKWWAQSYLVGIPTIVCGYKDNKGIVKQLEELKIDSFPDVCVEFWSANVCLNFLNRFLTHVKELVTIDDPNIVYQFAFQPDNDITCTRLTEPGEFQILPDWYIREMAF